MVRLTLAFTAPSARAAQEFIDTLRFLEPRTRLDTGCMGCYAWSEPDLTVHYFEEWSTEADLRRRVQSSDFTSLLGMVDAVKEPRVQFDFVSATRGLDYVAEVRGDFGP